MGNADAHHFDDYRAQTELKHRILERYLWAYLTALKQHGGGLLYVDAFAGPGVYERNTDCFDGSPIRAIKLIAADPSLRDRVKVVFVEKRPEYASELSTRLDQIAEAKLLSHHPELFHEPFESFAKSWRTGKVLRDFEDAATLLFVDPCGVDGVQMTDLAAVLRKQYCELFVFFNYDGVNRICGAAAATGSSETLTQLLGSQSRVTGLLSRLRGASAADREHLILSGFRGGLLADGGAKYALSFRVESESRQQTSHYFLHVTKDPLGFKIMKQVMWKVAAEGGGRAGLQLLQASAASPSLFEDVNVNALARLVTQELAAGARPVSHFTVAWVSRPTDYFSDRVYRDCLLKLEAEGVILVYDKQNHHPTPANKRRPRLGQPTLADDYWVRRA